MPDPDHPHRASGPPGPTDDLPPDIGPYRILERLGEGGMGEVFLAEQTEPIRRRVALKLIKAGMDSKEVVARFDSERQALAILNHPNIAQILDAGTTDTGRPYFVMEYVAGEHLTRYCDTHRLDLRQRLQLFIQVCQAIHHAHQNGIIHRDIKPSNILVAAADGEPVPKVIDFGVAKATQDRLTDKTMFTMHGVLMGTPAYMSPEQADLAGMNVDTTSDVYSLGVLLYEMLAGAPPFDAEELQSAGIAELHRIIREVEPPPPSRKVSTLGDRTTEVTAARQSDPWTWQKTVKGELDWITMRAMDKARSRRYQSAHALGEDLERFLRNDVISAGPPSQAYRLKKLIARNKLGALFAATVFVLVLAFGLSMGVLQQQASSARDEAEARARDLELVTSFQASMLSELDAEAMGQALFADLNRRIATSLEEEDPAQARARAAAFDEQLQRANPTDVALELLDVQILARAATALDEQFAEQPLIRADLQETVANTYRALGQYPPAIPLMESVLEIRRRELGDDHLRTIVALNSLGDLFLAMGMTDEAEEAYRESLAACLRTVGDNHTETFRSLANLGDVLHTVDELDSALVYYEAALEGHRSVLGEDDHETLIDRNNLAMVFHSLGRYEEALPHIRAAVDGERRVRGDDDPETLNSINNLGFTLQAMGEYEEARVYYEEALEGRRRTLGDRHPKTLVSVGTMAYLLKTMGRYEEALGYYLEVVEGRRESLGPEHPRTLLSTSHTGGLLRLMGRLDEALDYYETALDGMRSSLGESHSATMAMTHSMASLHLEMGHHREAMQLARAAHSGRENAFGPDDPATLESRILIARILRAEGDPARALALLRPLEPAARESFSEREPFELGIYLTCVGRSETALDEFSAAEEHLLEAASLFDPDAATELPQRRAALLGLAELYERWELAEPGHGHDQDAEQYRRQFANSQRRRGPD